MNKDIVSRDTSAREMDDWIHAAAKSVGYEEGFGVKGCNLSQDHWWSAYTRQSNEEQRNNSRLAEYLRTCAAEAKRLGVIVPRDYVFYDVVTGEHLERPGMIHLRRELAPAQRIAGVIFPVLDRLSREPTHIGIFEFEMDYHGVHYHYGDAPNGSDPMSQMVRQNLAHAAKFVKLVNRKNNRAGNMGRALKGIAPAFRPSYGYIYRAEYREESGRKSVIKAWWELNTAGPDSKPDQGSPAWVVQNVFNWVGNEERTLHWVAREMNRLGVPTAGGSSWNPGKVQRLVRNPCYTGKHAYNVHARVPSLNQPLVDITAEIKRNRKEVKPESEWVYFDVPMLVEEDLWKRANELIAIRGRGRGKQGKSIDALLRGRIHCPRCQQRMVVRRHPRYKERAYYHCKTYGQRWRERPCTYNTFIPASWDEVVWADLCSMLRDESWLDAEVASAQQKDEAIGELLRQQQLKVAQAQRKMVGVQEGFEGAIYSLEQAQTRVAQLKTDIGEAEREIKRLRERATAVPRSAADMAALKGELRNLRDRNLDEAPFPERTNLVARLGLRVYAYIAGRTRSTDFPTTPGAFDRSCGSDGKCDAVVDDEYPNDPPDPEKDAFVTKLNADGSALGYSTFLGGKGDDEARGIAVDGFGNAHVTGVTDSADFPTVNAAQPVKGTGSPDAFVTRFDAQGSPVYSTYLGGAGSRGDHATAIAVDPSGNAYVTGWTHSANFPLVAPIQSQLRFWDAFVTKFDGGGKIVYSTYLGGGDGDNAYGIAVDTSGNAYVTGLTQSFNFPTVDAIQPRMAGIPDMFVTKLNAAGSALVYSTYLGGKRIEWPNAIAADASGNAYVTGWTRSTDFPLANARQPIYGGDTDAFVVKIGEAITVNSDNDTDDGGCDKAHCSLREAVNAANAKSGQDLIFFNIPGTEAPTIDLLDALPKITDPVTIDGTSQTTGGKVKLDGTGIQTTSSGLVITAGKSTVKGLVVKNFPRHGIVLEGEGNNRIENNVITSNVGSGVVVVSGSGNTIRSNSIFSNGASPTGVSSGLGIDLGGDGVTDNDHNLDFDEGPNNLQNFPEIEDATTSDGSTTINGTLHSTPSTTFRLEFFSNTICNLSNFGEGQLFIGFTDLTTDATGDASFASTFQVTGSRFTATATDPQGNTSEFSLCGQDVRPDLAVKAFSQTPGGFGQKANITYTAANIVSRGVIPDTARWDEVLVLRSGSAWEKQWKVGSFSGVGGRSITVDLPALGETPSTVGSGVVTAQMVKDGMEFVVRLDPGGALVEVDENNNEHVEKARWKLPDLAATLPGRPEGVQFGGRDTFHLTYKVKNAGGGSVPSGSTWTEQVWIGTDERVWMANDPANGVWHHKLAVRSGDTRRGPAGPGTQSTGVSVLVDLTLVQLPDGIGLANLKWIVLVDWDVDAQGKPHQPAGVDPGKVLEAHEAPPQTTPARPPNAFLFPVSTIDLSPLHLVVSPTGSDIPWW